MNSAFSVLPKVPNKKKGHGTGRNEFSVIFVFQLKYCLLQNKTLRYLRGGNVFVEN